MTVDFSPRLAPDLGTTASDPVEARHTLRAQIADLERRLQVILSDEDVPATIPAARRPGTPVAPGPRVLGLGELELVRDDLVARVEAVRAAFAARQAAFAERLALLEAALADPAAHPGLRITQEEIGKTGCTRWSVRPVLGPLGRLLGWWRVKISSGCP